ncbi:hypothetical protein [Sphingomonas sp. Marseille-Q8236]
MNDPADAPALPGFERIKTLLLGAARSGNDGAVIALMRDNAALAERLS